MERYVWFVKMQLVDDHQMTITGQLLHQSFDYMTAQHVVKSRASRRANNDGIDVERPGCIGDRLSGIMRYRRNRHDLDLILPSCLQHCLERLHSLLVRHVRRPAGKQSLPLLDIETVQSRLAASPSASYRLFDQLGFSSRSATSVDDEYKGFI
jgi:hypothetical protein